MDTMDQYFNDQIEHGFAVNLNNHVSVSACLAQLTSNELHTLEVTFSCMSKVRDPDTILIIGKFKP